MCLSLDRKGQSRRAKFPKTVCVIGFCHSYGYALGKKNPKTERKSGQGAREQGRVFAQS